MSAARDVLAAVILTSTERHAHAKGDATAMTTLVRTTTISALLLTTALVGCARRPAMSAAAAPAPSGQATASAPAESAAPQTTEIISEEQQREVVFAQRPEPSTFAENANVKPVYFDFDRAEIRPDGARTLENDAAWLKANDVLILIEGQCDERGTEEYNLALGDRRAHATRSYLMALGIAAERINTVSYGKERPVCTEHAEECWQLNRRAHILVKPRG